MATQETTTSTIEEQRRSGALACIEALRTLTALAENVATRCGNEPRDAYEIQLSDAKAFAQKLGPMTPYCEGVIIALAEYVHSTESTGIPNLEPGAWLPWAAKTPQEREADVAWMAACFAEADGVSHP